MNSIRKAYKIFPYLDYMTFIHRQTLKYLHYSRFFLFYKAYLEIGQLMTVTPPST
jgi:hypothetical protein